MIRSASYAIKVVMIAALIALPLFGVVSLTLSVPHALAQDQGASDPYGGNPSAPNPNKVGAPVESAQAEPASDKCKPSILGIQGWQKYLKFKGDCELDLPNDNSPGRLSFIWLIVAGLLDAGMRIAALIATGFFLYGGFKLITSQGSPESVKAGKETMKNALIGLVICIVGVAVQSIIMGILDVKV